MKIQKIHVKGSNIESFIKDFENNFKFEFKFNSNSQDTNVFVTEDYSFRISSSMSITTIIEKNEDSYLIYLIVAGGTSGMMEIDYGAEKSRLKKYMKYLQNQALKYNISLDAKEFTI